MSQSDKELPSVIDGGGTKELPRRTAELLDKLKTEFLEKGKDSLRWRAAYNKTRQELFAAIDASSPRPSTLATVDGPLGGFAPVGQEATQLDFMLTQFEVAVQTATEDSTPPEEADHQGALALKLKREIIDRYTPRSARAEPSVLRQAIVDAMYHLGEALTDDPELKVSAESPHDHCQKAFDLLGVALVDNKNATLDGSAVPGYGVNRCNKHGGYGFTRDCDVCYPPSASPDDTAKEANRG